ncbi:MAG: alpha/beta hydrolase [Pseudomonadota bacterium]
MTVLPDLPLPSSLRTRQLSDVNGLELYLLEAGDPDAPCILLLHGFPDLAYGWRNVMGPLAAAGYFVIAPDLRGYGRTRGWPDAYETELRPFGTLNLVKDLVALLRELKIRSLHALVGHDFGSPLAAYFALLRSDMVQRLVLMSAPFPGPPGLGASRYDMDAALAALEPPRQHYQTYYSGPDANTELLQAPQGLKPFLRAYFHMKSADWPPNQPYALEGWRAEELAKLPEYYVMRRGQTMAATVAPALPDTRCDWLTDDELDVYCAEYARTGFQGGLNWYRCTHDPVLRAELAMLAGRPLAMPCWFVSGASDWGNHQTPGALKRLEERAASDYRGTQLIAGAGHWVQQEQPEATVAALLDAAMTPR